MQLNSGWFQWMWPIDDIKEITPLCKTGECEYWGTTGYPLDLGQSKEGLYKYISISVYTYPYKDLADDEKEQLISRPLELWTHSLVPLFILLKTCWTIMLQDIKDF